MGDRKGEGDTLNDAHEGVKKKKLLQHDLIHPRLPFPSPPSLFLVLYLPSETSVPRKHFPYPKRVPESRQPM